MAGPKGNHDPHRDAYRHGYETNSVNINGVNNPLARPWARTLSGHEVEIESFELARTNDLLCEVALNRMLHGLSSRNYDYGSDNPGGKGASKSVVSRLFIQATGGELKSC